MTNINRFENMFTCFPVPNKRFNAPLYYTYVTQSIKQVFFMYVYIILYYIVYIYIYLYSLNANK